MRQILFTVAASLAIASSASAATVNVKLLNQGSDGTPMVFEPAFVKAKAGDTIHFIATDKGHNVESIKGMLPEGADPITGMLGQDTSVVLSKPGVYGVRCMPHVSMGMVALIVVGKPTNEDAAKTAMASTPNAAKAKLAKLFTQLDGK